MAITILEDRLEGTAADLGSLGSAASRGFFAYGVEGRDDLAIYQMYNALRAKGYAYGSQFPGITNLGLTRLVFESLGAGQFRGRAIYELVSPGAFSANSAVLIEDGGTIQQYTTRLMPGTKEPIWVDYSIKKTGSQSQAKDTFDAKVPWDYVPMNLFRAVRTIRVTTTTYKVPPQDYSDAANLVNSDVWCGKKPGYWLITEARVSLSTYENWFVTSATAYTKVDEDWSEYGILQQQQTGRFVPLDDAYVKTFTSKPYKPKVVDRGNGIVRVCPYNWTSFRNIFGFSVRPGQHTVTIQR